MLLELFLAGLALLLLAVLKDRKPAGMPPGPPEIPYVGQSPGLTEEAARKLRDKYGSLVTTRVGNLRMVYVFDYNDVKDLFTRQELSARPEFFKKFNLDDKDNVGVVFNSGPLWSHGRRFILRQLRALGNGKSRLEEAVLTETNALMHYLASFEGEPVTNLTCFEMGALNVIWQLTTGRRYPLDANEVRSIYELADGVQKAAVGTVALELFPVLSWLPAAIKDKFFGQKYMRDFSVSIRNLIKKSVAEHQANGVNDESKDFINDYLREMEEQDFKGDSTHKLRIEGLYQLMYDLFNAGSQTVADMIRWVVHYMVKYPAAVRRCQKEIDDLLSHGEPVTLEHKQSLPLVEAFTNEVLRHSSMILFLPQRVADKDISIRGYTLPKGTLITTCTALIHRDPRHWTEPDLFSPDRFLDENGNFNIRRDGFLPFGIGRRQCAAESLARSEIFLFSATLLQNFHVHLPEGVKLHEEPRPNTPPLRLSVNQPFVFTLRRSFKDDIVVT